MPISTAFERIEIARTARDLFPQGDGARAVYRQLAREVHPDIHVNGEFDRAEKAFARLTELWNQRNAPTVLTYATRRHSYTQENLLAKGDIANVYKATYDAGHEVVVIKFPRNPANGELIANEISILKALNSDVPEQYRMYHSTTVDSFRHRDKDTGKDRRAIVLEYLDGFYTLREVMQEYPDGLDGRDLAWMVRRLWVALATAHDAGIAHGAVTPENVMIHPTMHGVVLIDWIHAKPFGDNLTTLSSPYRDFYGTHLDKPLDHRLDVQMASHTLELLLGARSHKPFRAFFKGCRVASAPPAGQLFQEFDELLARLYGKRKFRPFTMPAANR